MYNVYTFMYLCTDMYMYSRCRVQPGACNTHVQCIQGIAHSLTHVFWWLLVIYRLSIALGGGTIPALYSREDWYHNIHCNT